MQIKQNTVKDTAEEAGRGGKGSAGSLAQRRVKRLTVETGLRSSGTEALEAG